MIRTWVLGASILLSLAGTAAADVDFPLRGPLTRSGDGPAPVLERLRGGAKVAQACPPGYALCRNTFGQTCCAPAPAPQLCNCSR